MNKSIEQRAIKEYGLTEVYYFALYMLIDGTMLNGSYEGYQRDEDHRNIGCFFNYKTHIDKYDMKVENYEPWQNIVRFINRGNIRMSCSSQRFGIEFHKLPTRAQWEQIKKMSQEAYKMDIEFIIERADSQGNIRQTWNGRYDFISFTKWLDGKVNYYLC